jgi:hypothetical protein|tara:strand:- start:29 stop:607 length:579 start_codon:yes stop_codon:yes gene_type:complete
MVASDWLVHTKGKKTIEDLTYVCTNGDTFLDPWIAKEYIEVEAALMVLQGTGEYQPEVEEFMPEWAPMTEDIVFGTHEDPDEWYQNLWDEHEMSKDMDAFERDNACQGYIADHGITDDTRTTCDVVITHRGDNYLTGSTDIGKVYIPQKLAHRCTGGIITCTMIYAGTPDCREARNIKIPWRAIFIGAYKTK